ncbi:MAG: hypothetical protein ABI273_15840 [Lacunisphaera sp.]
MKNSPSDPDARWENLLNRARRDVGPTADLSASLRAIQHVELAPAPTGWAADFSHLFSSGPVIPACLAGAAAFALIATWQVWDTWQTLPWVQLIDSAVGGSS